MNLTDIFLTLVDMSVAASWVALAVMALRLALKKAPKWISCLLWVLVAVRLVCPFTLESAFSLMHLEGARETVDSMLDGYSGPSHTYWDITEEYEAAVNAGIEPIHGGEGHYYVVTGETPTTEVPIVADRVAPVWVAGMGVMLAYALVSYWRIRRKVSASIAVGKGIFLCDYIDTPFILGIVKPKIYLPSAMDAQTATHVIAHERAHLKRKDHWWKPLGFLLLTVHWFNPVIWLAYVLLCRDIELACDEKVIREMGTGEKKAYSEALLSCSVPRHMIAACPLAFGEVGVKERVKTVLNYKKPAFWIILIAVIALIVASVCLLTDPVADLNDQRKFDLPGPNVSDMDVQEVIKQIRKYNGLKENENPYVNDYVGDIILAENFDFELVFIPYYYHQNQKTYLSIATFNELTEGCILMGVDEWEDQETLFLLEHYLNALKYMPKDEISAMLSNPENYRIRFVEEGTPGSYNRVIRYSSEGVGVTDGWLIHLEVIPASYENGGFPETGEESVHLFYGDASVDSVVAVDIAAGVKSAVEDYLENGSPYLTLSESDTAFLEQLDWDKMVYTGCISGGGNDYVFTVNEPTVIDGEEVEYYTVKIGVAADGELTNFFLSGPEQMADTVQEGNDIVIPYVLGEDGTLIPVLETSENRLYVKSNLVSFYDGQERPGYYCLNVGELGYLMNILEDIPESAWEEGLHEQNYEEFSSKLMLVMAHDPADEMDEIEAHLLYTDGGVNLKLYKDGSLLEKSYHIRYEPLTEFIESLCDGTRREGNIYIMYPDTVVEYIHEDINVALQPMVGWRYEIVPYTDDSTPFGIRCRPEWEEEGWLFVSYWPDGFTCCGTGLETTEGNWGSNLYDTITGYYDGNENWSFIHFADTPYVILNEEADPWFERADDIYRMVAGYSGEGVLPPNTELVQYSHGYVNMSLRLPPSWEYEIEEWTETNENGLDIQTCGIRFRPEGQEGWVALRFRSDIFGAFSQEDLEKYPGTSVEFADYEVTLGGPQYGNVWRYIYYNFYRNGRTYIPGNYIAWNEGADKWMRETDNNLRLMKILYTVDLGQGVLRSDQALEIACNAVQLPEDYNYGMEHDYLTGIYTVCFSSKEGEKLCEVQLDNSGNIMELCSYPLADATAPKE